MGGIPGINGIRTQSTGLQSYTGGYGGDVFDAFKKQTLNPIKNEDVFNAPKKDKAFADKEKKAVFVSSLKKAGIAIALCTIFIEFNLRRNPRKIRYIKEYEEIFSNTTGTEIRDFSMIPFREEVIIKEAAKGSKKATEMLPSLSCNGEGIMKYIKTQNKIKNAEKLYLEGRFDNFTTKTCTAEQVQDNFFKNYIKLQNKANALYQKYIEPLK